MLPPEQPPTRFFGWLEKGVGLSREAPLQFLSTLAARCLFGAAFLSPPEVGHAPVGGRRLYKIRNKDGKRML